MRSPLARVTGPAKKRSVRPASSSPRSTLVASSNPHTAPITAKDVAQRHAVNPDTVSGIAISLQMVFGVIAGGMFVMLGPTVGAAFTLLLAEGLRLGFGNKYPALDTTIYGVMLVLFIIFMPKGILGAVLDLFRRKRS